MSDTSGSDYTEPEADMFDRSATSMSRTTKDMNKDLQAAKKVGGQSAPKTAAKKGKAVKKPEPASKSVSPVRKPAAVK